MRAGVIGGPKVGSLAVSLLIPPPGLGRDRELAASKTSRSGSTRL